MSNSKKTIQKLDSPSVNAEEVEKFSKLADQWWDEEGKFKPLHKFNPIRIKYLKDNLVKHFNLSTSSVKPFKGLRILDIGCGGGLLSVPMARLGADVFGVDASEKNIKVAQNYAERNDIKNVKFIHSTAEEMEKQGEQFDVVLNMEVIEHVEDVENFMKSCCNLIKPDGLMFVATLNRTIKSYAFAILGAEYIMRWLPVGTHDWKNFLKPSEINNYFEENGLKLKDSSGLKYNPLRDEFSLSDDLSVNFIMIGGKK